MGSRAVLDAVKGKIPSPQRESNLRTPIVQPVGAYIVSECFLCDFEYLLDLDVNVQQTADTNLSLQR
jgi:hypothetical protein